MTTHGIAVVGMAGRFPGCIDVDAFWQHIRDGVECITFFDEAELHAAGVSEEVLGRPNYVRAAGVLDDIESFDAEFFGFTARDAEITDPQHRLFLEESWHALEDAGYAGAVEGTRVGVFGGVGPESYLWNNVIPVLGPAGLLDPVQARVHNDKDFFTTWVSYKLGLEGPSMAVQTACSTSLVAVHLACESLRAGECDMALAGGASIPVPHRVGYLHQRGGVRSPDGHCRPFDAAGQGFVTGSGVVVVVLKRLVDALRDGDRISAVVRGSAINNDGAVRAGFTAPGVEGQVRVVTAALERAGVDAGSIGYVEAHGTGTALGDPVEVEALTTAFGPSDEHHCALGSVKANVGHLDAAAGAAGLVKAALVLRHAEIPPMANFSRLNPLVELEKTPFYVPTERRPWTVNGGPRRAAVTSLGMGGTNAHVVLEEAPLESRHPRPDRPLLLPLAARTRLALERCTTELADRLRIDTGACLADVAWTLQVGRRHFDERRFVLAETIEEAVQHLGDADELRHRSGTRQREVPTLAFVFPGQGAQYVGMGKALYEGDFSAFRDSIDECAEILATHVGWDVREMLFPSTSSAPSRSIDDTAVAQPALFVVEYALAEQWRAWGIEPTAMAGHSIGEYVAACLAGVFSLPDALHVVAERGRLMQACRPGSMLAVRASADEVRDLLARLGHDDDLVVAAVNAPRSCVVSGPDADIRRLAETAALAAVPATPLRTSHAFHSPAMDDAVPPFVDLVASVSRAGPRVPVLSNVTGTWLRDEEATDPAYWGRHLRETVRFSENLAVLLGNGDLGIVEVGPPALEGLVRQQPACGRSRLVVSSMPRVDESGSASDSRRRLLDSLGRLWVRGAAVDWTRVSVPSECRRMALPLYPFERRRHWIEAERDAPVVTPSTARGSTPISSATVEPSTEAATPTNASIEDTEHVMLTIWRDVFGFEHVATTDNFFDLGGDSLSALQLLNRIEDILGVELPMEVLFDAETVSDMANAVKELRAS